MHRPDFSKREIGLCTFRSLYITLFLFFAFLASHLIDGTIWIASLAATTFIVFEFPKSQSVKPRVVLGGYISASVWGVIAALLLTLFRDAYIITLLFCAGAIFLTALSMTVLDFEHPPSLALTVGIVISDKPIEMALLALLFVSILCLIRPHVSRLMLIKQKKNEKCVQDKAEEAIEEEKACEA